MLEFAGESSGGNRLSRSCGAINDLIGWLLAEVLPCVDLARDHLAGGEQRAPRTAWRRFRRRGSKGWVLMRRLNSSAGARWREFLIDFHWPGGCSNVQMSDSQVH